MAVPESAGNDTDYASLPARVVTSDGDGLWETWHGSGTPIDRGCGACGNVTGNKQIYGNRGVSYPNGNSWTDSEIVCAACERYTLRLEFREG